MFKKKRTNNKKGRQSNFAKLSIFKPQKYKFKKKCPLSGKDSPAVDYKNIRLLKKYMSVRPSVTPPHTSARKSMTNQPDFGRKKS